MGTLTLYSVSSDTAPTCGQRGAPWLLGGSGTAGCPTGTVGLRATRRENARGTQCSVEGWKMRFLSLPLRTSVGAGPGFPALLGWGRAAITWQVLVWLGGGCPERAGSCWVWSSSLIDVSGWPAFLAPSLKSMRQKGRLCNLPVSLLWSQSL